MLVLIRFYFVGLVTLLMTSVFLKTLFVFVHREYFITLSWGEIVYALIWGLRFDLSLANQFLALPFIFTWLILRLKISMRLGWLLQPSLFILVGLQISDIIYFKESGRHLGYELKHALPVAKELFLTFLNSSALLIFLALFLPLLGGWISLKWSGCTKKKGVLSPKLEVCFIVLLFFSVAQIRFNINDLPLSPISAYRIGSDLQGVIAQNGAYNATRYTFRPYRKGNFDSVSNLFSHSSKDLQLTKAQQLKILKQMLASPSLLKEKDKIKNKKPKNYNIVFIFLESWPAIHMKSYGGKRSTTPFFDQLKHQSFSTKDMIANGTRTSEGLFSVFCSSQNPLGQSIPSSPMQDFNYSCLPSLLKELGWSSVFIQGTHRDTSKVGAFTRKIGFESDFGKEQIPPNRYTPNNWGLHDPDIYDFALSRMKVMKQPFLVAINTNSTHDSLIPEEIIPQFGNKNTEDIRDSLLYFSDQALKDFFSSYKNSAHFKPTIFILLADHSSGLSQSAYERFLIPFLITSVPEQPHLQKKNLNFSASQRDVVPTLLSLLDIPKPRWFSGHSLIKSFRMGHLADYFGNGLLGYIEGDHRVEINIIKKKITSCFKRGGNHLSWKKTLCKKQHTKIAQKGIVFTIYNQKLLLSGQITRFGDTTLY